MQAVILLYVLVALATNGAVFARSPKIVGGEIANPGEFPSQGSLQNQNEHVCSATVIKEGWAVTAAHCVYGFEVTDHSVLVGTNKLSEGGSRHAVTQIIVHEDYNRTDSWRNDIALLKVDPSFDTTGPNVKAIKLPTQGQSPAVGTKATVIGWGASVISGPLSDDLKKVDLEIRDQQLCADAYATLKLNIEEGQVCADDPDGMKGSCNGDTGSPLIVDDVLEGLASFTLLCAVKGYPAVYTRVSQYSDWIEKNSAS